MGEESLQHSLLTTQKSLEILSGAKQMFDYKIVESKLNEIINIVKTQLSDTQI